MDFDSYSWSNESVQTRNQKRENFIKAVSGVSDSFLMYFRFVATLWWVGTQGLKMYEKPAFIYDEWFYLTFWGWYLCGAFLISSSVAHIRYQV